MDKDKVSDWWKALWWSRGAVGVVTLTSLVAPYIGLERIEALRILHAIVVGWNLIASFIGKLISIALPFYVGSSLVNVFLLCTTTVWPLIYFIGRTNFQLGRGTIGSFPKYILVLSLVAMSLMAMYVIFNKDESRMENINNEARIIFAFDDLIQDEGVRAEFRTCVNRNSDSLGCVAEYAESIESNEKDIQFWKDVGGLGAVVWFMEDMYVVEMKYYFYIFVIVSIIALYISTLLSISYRRGVIHVLMIFLTIEILYHLPVAGKFLNQFADFVLTKT